MTSLARHAIEVLALVVVVAGPIPVCAAVASIGPTPRASAAERLLAGLVLWFTLEIGIAVTLATTGSLALGPLLLVEGALLVLGCALARPRLAPFLPTRPLELAEQLVVAAIVVLGVDLLLRLATEPITDHDSLGYHLPPVARWIQAGSLIPLERTDYVSRFPYGWELLGALCALPFREDFLVTLPNLIAWATLGLAVYTGGRALGAPRLHALAASFCVLALPVTREQVPTMRVDLAVAAFFVAGVTFALARSPLPFFAALALAAGIKTSGLVYSGLLLATFVVARWSAIDAPRPSPGWARMLYVPIFLVGAFWYARNLVQLGSPLGLVGLGVGDVTPQPGWVDAAALRRTTLASLFDPSEPAHWAILGGAIRENLRLPFLLLAAASLALVVFRKRRPRPPLLLVCGLLVACAAAYATTPFSGGLLGVSHLTRWASEQVRHALPFLGLLGVLGAEGAATVVGPLPVVVAVSFVFAGLTHASTVAAATLVMVVLVCIVFGRQGAVRAAVLAPACCLALVLTSFWMRERRAAARPQRYGPIAERLARELAPGTAVGHVATARTFLLYGPNLTNHVTYVPATGDDREAWLRMLHERSVGLVALGPLEPRHRRRREIAWLADPTGPFECVAGDDPVRETVLYRLR